MPSLVDQGDGSFSVASSVSKQSELLPQKLQFNNSADSTDVSTNPSIDGNPAEEVAAVTKKKKKKSMFTRMKTSFRGTKTQNQKENVKKLPQQAAHTLHAPDDWGNVECYVLDAHAVRVEEQEKNKGLRPVGLVSDDCGNVECRALEKGAVRTEEMEPPVAQLVSKLSVEEEQLCSMKQLGRQICTQPSTDTAMIADCNKGTVDCSFYDQIYAQLMGSPSDLNEPIACIDNENLNLPDLPAPKEIVDGIKKGVQGGLKHVDDTLECAVNNIFPVREDITTIQGLAITHSETEIEMEHSFTQAEI